MTGRQTLLGCGIGCLAVVLLAVGGCVGFMVWVSRPAPLLEASSLVDAETVAHVEWTLRLEDAATERVAKSMLARLRELQATEAAREAPGLAVWIQQLQRAQNDKQLRELFPLAVGWTAWPGSGGATDRELLGVSVAKLGYRMVALDWVLGFAMKRSTEVDVEKRGGESIYRERKHGVSFFLRPGSFFLASDLETAGRAVGLLDATAGTIGTSRIEELLAAIPDGAPLRGAATDAGAAMTLLGTRLLRREAARALEAIDWSSARGLRLWGGFVGDRGLTMTLHLASDDPAWRASAGAALAEVLRAAAGEQGGVRIEAIPDDAGARIDVTLDDVAALIERIPIETSGRKRD